MNRSPYCIWAISNASRWIFGAIRAKESHSTMPTCIDDRQRDSVKVSDRVVLHTVHSGVLERYDSVVERRNRNGIDGVSGTRGEERALGTIVTYADLGSARAN